MKDFCPEGEISLSYMNKRVGVSIFSHLKTVYLKDIKACKIELSYMGKLIYAIAEMGEIRYLLKF